MTVTARHTRPDEGVRLEMPDGAHIVKASAEETGGALAGMASVWRPVARASRRTECERAASSTGSPAPRPVAVATGLTKSAELRPPGSEASADESGPAEQPAMQSVECAAKPCLL